MRSIFTVIIAFALVSISASAQTPEVLNSQEALGGDGITLVEVSGVSGVEVVASSEPSDAGLIAFVVHNGTGEAVSIEQVKLDVRDGDELVGVATANSSTVAPAVIHPGDSAIGVMYAHDIAMPASPDFTFTVTTDEPGGLFDNTVSLVPADVNIVGDNLVGEVTNPTDDEVGFVTVFFACIGDGQEVTSFKHESQSMMIPGGGSSTFQLSGVGACEHYIVSAHAF